MAVEAKVKLRKNDVVKVISGREKGKTGRILRIDREKMRAVVEGLNMVKKAVKQRKQNEKGGITSVEAPLSVSKLMIVCKKCGPDAHRLQDGRRDARSGSAARAEASCEQGERRGAEGRRRRQRRAEGAKSAAEKPVKPARAEQAGAEKGQKAEKAEKAEKSQKAAKAAEGAKGGGRRAPTGRQEGRRRRRGGAEGESQTGRRSPRLQAAPEEALPGDGREGPEGRVRLQLAHAGAPALRRSS